MQLFWRVWDRFLLDSMGVHHLYTPPMSAANTDSPEYLKPSPGYGMPGPNSCKHENIVPSEANDKNIYPFVCKDCSAKFPEVSVETVEGRLREKSFAFNNGKRRRR